MSTTQQSGPRFPVPDWLRPYHQGWLRLDIVALDLKAVFDLEYTALKMLTEAEQRHRQNGVQLWLVGLNPGVLEMVQHSPLGQTLGRDRMFFDLEQAVARYQSSSA